MRRSSILLLILAVVLPAAGCTAGGNGGPTISGDLPETKGRDDPFSPWQEHATAALRTGGVPNVTTVRLIGRRDRKTGAISTHARVAVYYEDYVKRYYDTARDSRADTLRLTVVTRDFPLCGKRPCRYSEEMTVDIPEADLRAALAAGKSYAFKLFSRVGKDNVVDIPKDLVASLLASLGRATGPAAAAGPADRRDAAADSTGRSTPAGRVFQSEDDE